MQVTEDNISQNLVNFGACSQKQWLPDTTMNSPWPSSHAGASPSLDPCLLM